ncbi:MAG: lysine--tRNA ligase, partial [Actinomycetota bacterium]|nr:lysine--tRNA ligase [Actinomycetota bacterium]
IRKFLDNRDFVEVETPMLHPIPGGAAARPFVTHHNALGIDLYLRIAPELYLKRLLVAGYEKVYELNRNFRNEGISTKHNPEFTMLEAYQAFVDYKYLMDFMEELLPSIIESATKSRVVEFNGQKISLEPPWERITLLEALKSRAGLEVSLSLELEKLKKIADQNAVEVPPGSGPGRIVVELFEKLVEPRLIKPTFVMDFPEETSPLARKKKEDPRLTERFELIIGGQEIANAFSELTDPIDQRRRFEEQALKRKAGDEEAQPIDEDFLEALEYGMPPAGGLGIGIDRLAMLASGKSNIKEVITFPHLRPQEGR